MATRDKVSAQHSAEARFNQLTVERFRGDPQKARQHSDSRNNRVAELLCYFSLLRSAGRVAAGATVTCQRAVRQHFSSSGGYQAAHYLPGQVNVNGARPWAHITDGPTRLALEALFGDVEHMPANLNKADTAAEFNGLKKALADTCEWVVRDSHPLPGNRINRERVRQAYRVVWIPSAERAFRAGLGRKNSRPHLPPLLKDADGNIDPQNLAERSLATDAQWNIEEQLRILEHYLSSLRTQPPSLLDYRMDELERAFRP